MKKTAKKIITGTVGAAGMLLATAATTANADSVHRVVKNDTVWSLSEKFGVSIKSIEQLNHIDQNSNMIYVGQDLQIPNKDAQPQKSQKHTYVVQAGDSLWTIAQRFHTTVDHLKQLNGLSSNLIHSGQSLKIDGQATASASVAKTDETAPVVQKAAQPVSSVRPAASVSSIASSQKAAPVQAAQSSVASVQSVPTAQSQSTSATIQSAPAVQKVQSASTVASTTASSVTKAPVITVSSVQSTQASSSSSSQVVKPSSQAIVNQSSVSSQATVASSVRPVTQVSSSANSQATVTSSVRTTAQVSSVASSQSSSKQAVIAANHTSYTVKSGDSLYTIAQKYGVSVNAIREANPNLNGALVAGQSIIINNPAAVSSQQSTPAQKQSTQNQNYAATAQKQSTTNNNNNASQQQQTNNKQQQQPAAQQSSQAAASSTTRTGSGSNVVSFAESLQGVPYVYGGTTPNGFDCSGFVQYVYNHFGVNLPRTTTQQENCGTQISANDAQPGDLYFWGNKGSAYHVAICVGNGKYIAAPEPGQSVSVGSTQYFQPSFAVHL